MQCQSKSHDCESTVLQQKEVDAVCKAVAEILRTEREARGLSMNAVAERGGLSQQMVSYVERGMRKPTVDTLLRIAYAIGMDIADVLHRAQSAAAKKGK
jgi:transcriptional regulator with XRE-family HTH domain